MSMKSLLAVANTIVGMMFSVSNVFAAENAGETAAAVADTAVSSGFTENVTFGQVLEFQLTGLLVVFTVLGGLTITCYLLAWLLKTVAPDQFHCKPKSKPAVLAPKAAAPAVAATPVPVAAPAAAAVQPSASIHPGLTDEEFLAILAVAATEVLGQAVSIVRFRAMDSMDWTWSVQGRVGLHTSHTP